MTDPDLKMTTRYEWVVEHIDETAGERDIIEIWHFNEDDRAGAEAFAAECVAQGDVVDFGLCRDRGNNAEGITERGYAYRDEAGNWPDTFDDGNAIPKRFGLK